MILLDQSDSMKEGLPRRIEEAWDAIAKASAEIRGPGVHVSYWGFWAATDGKRELESFLLDKLRTRDAKHKFTPLDHLLDRNSEEALTIAAACPCPKNLPDECRAVLFVSDGLDHPTPAQREQAARGPRDPRFASYVPGLWLHLVTNGPPIAQTRKWDSDRWRSITDEECDPCRRPEQAINSDLTVASVASLSFQGVHRCSGVVVESSWLLTARHCLPVDLARFGTQSNATVEVHHVAETVVHPDPEADVALLRIPTMTKAPADRRCSNDDPEPRDTLYAIGFGARDHQGALGAGQRRWVGLRTTGWGCRNGDSGPTRCRPDSEMAIVDASGADTCDGDSGGPVFEVLAEQDQCRLRLVSSVSRPIASATFRCGSGGIYTRVGSISRWIDQATGSACAEAKQ
ncbi:MAG: trypsin-like serine protease [Deltaproteobacteria bacterium]|nr:trypsin-like serine protease [Deltaproteobacteria bacterium]